VSGDVVVTRAASGYEWVRVELKADLRLLAAIYQVIVVVPGCATDEEERMITAFFASHFAEGTADGPALQLHVVCCEQASSVTHIVRRVEPHCTVLVMHHGFFAPRMDSA
jgi:hypothetical protein